MGSLPESEFLPIVMGTAQLGIPYGLGAASQGMDAGNAEALLQAAWNAGIRYLDTAPSYGLAERRIGQWMNKTAAKPSIITKLPPIGNVPSEDLVGFVRGAINASRAALGCEILDGVLLHKPSDLRVSGISAALGFMRDGGLISAFGASVYTVDEARVALALPGLELLQIPGSLLNPTLLDAGIADTAAAAGVTVLVRSAFVQGLLLRSPDDLPGHLRGASSVLRELNALTVEANTNMMRLAISAIASFPGVTSLVLGFDTPEQLREALSAFALPVPDFALLQAALRIGRTTPNAIADPRFWKSE